MDIKIKKLDRTLKNQAGATLIEIISYLGIAAVVVVGAVMLLNSAFGGANADRTLKEVAALQMNVKKLFMGQQAGYGAAALNTTLNSAGKLPTTLRFNAGNIFNAWNSAVIVTGATNEFTISYAGVPQDVCVDLVSMQGGAGWVNIAVNGAAALVPPITPAQATGATGCNAAANTIVWRSN